MLKVPRDVIRRPLKVICAEVVEPETVPEILPEGDKAILTV